MLYNMPTRGYRDPEYPPSHEETTVDDDPLKLDDIDGESFKLGVRAAVLAIQAALEADGSLPQYHLKQTLRELARTAAHEPPEADAEK
jgi:hypothetical protein